MSVYISYLFQSLNIKCFSLLKWLYNKEIKNFVYTYMTYIIKIKFFSTFKNAFFISLNKKNI
jgi:hypothetical protein